MYNIYNKETGELLESQVDEQRLIDFANEEFAETDNLEDAIENDLLFYDNAHAAQESLEASQAKRKNCKKFLSNSSAWRRTRCVHMGACYIF